MEPRGIATVLDDPVPRRWQEEKTERQQHREERGKLQRPLGGAELLVTLLEERPVLEPEQDLRAEHQHARFVERVLHFSAQGHVTNL